MWCQGLHVNSIKLLHLHTVGARVMLAPDGPRGKGFQVCGCTSRPSGMFRGQGLRFAHPVPESGTDAHPLHRADSGVNSLPPGALLPLLSGENSRAGLAVRASSGPEWAFIWTCPQHHTHLGGGGIWAPESLGLPVAWPHLTRSGLVAEAPAQPILSPLPHPVLSLSPHAPHATLHSAFLSPGL